MAHKARQWQTTSAHPMSSAKRVDNFWRIVAIGNVLDLSNAKK